MLLDMNTVDASRNRTPFFHQFSCGVGHVINDVTRRMLTSFRLIFLMKVVGMSATNVGWITLYSFFVGAIIFGPLAGYLCDKVNIPVLSRKQGKRKSWHLVGTMLAAISLPLSFSPCLVCSGDPSEWQLMVNYFLITTFVVISINLIEIAHLSIIPVIAKDYKEAVKLNALRLACVFLTGIATYLVAWAILGQENQRQLTSESSMNFTKTTLILTGMGLVFSVIFYIGTKEPSDCPAVEKDLSTAVEEPVHLASNEEEKRKRSEQQSSERVVPPDRSSDMEMSEKEFKACSAVSTECLGANGNEAKSKLSSKNEIIVVYADKDESKSLQMDRANLECDHPATLGPKTVRAWLKDPHLYKVAIIYACTRSLQDVSYSYLPLLLTDRLKFGQGAIANLPLVVLISATVSTGISKKLVEKVGSKWTFICAGLVVIGSCVWFYFIAQSTRVLTYPAAVLLGLGFSAMFVNAINFGNELIGNNKSTSGFVFAFMATAANLTVGTLFITIQKFFPEKSKSEDCEECGDYIRHVLSLVPGSLAAVSLLIVLVFQASPINLFKSRCHGRD